MYPKRKAEEGCRHCARTFPLKMQMLFTFTFRFTLRSQLENVKFVTLLRDKIKVGKEKAGGRFCRAQLFYETEYYTPLLFLFE